MPTGKTAKPTADFSQVLNELKKLSKGWTKVAQEQANANKIAAQTAKNVKSQTTSVSGLIKEVQKLNKSYRDLINQQKASSKATTKSVSADKAKSREIAKQIKLTDRMIQRGFTQRDIAKKGATSGETLNYKNEIGKLKELQKKFGGMKAHVNRMWGDLAKGNIVAYTGKQRRLQNQLIKVKKAQDQLGVSARKAHSAAMLSRYNKEAKAFVKQHHAIKGVTGALHKADSATKGLLVSWKSFARLLAVQVFHQAVSAFIRATRDAIIETIELEKRISEVQTISQELPLTFQRWRDELKGLSDKFGLPILDTIEAAYQTLSNQIAEGAETIEFLGVVSKFAVTSVTSMSDSVNLTTAALNAFNLTVDDTEEVTAKFFKTIELGRVRGSEMANTFGRIGVPANQLTIKIEELQAAIASSTIQGLKYNEAATLIRNVLLKLIRPTDAMKQLFAEWGVESGEAAIKTFGFAGVLAKIEEHAQGSSTELGELFGRIRAITGAMLFAGEGLDRYNDALVEITNAQDDYGQRTAIVMQNVGKRLDIEFNKIKNFFTVDLADKLLRDLDKIFLGFENLTVVIKAAADVFKGIFVAALAAAGAGVITLTLLIDKLSAATQRNIILIGLLAAISANRFFKRKHEANMAEINKAIKDSQKEWLGRELKNIDDVFKERVENLDEINKKELEQLAEKASATRAQQIDEEENYKRFIQLNKRLGKEVTQSIKSNISRLKKEIKALDKIIDTSKAKMDLEEGISDVAIARRLSGKDRTDQLEPSAERKYDFLNAEIIRQQEFARRAALALDKEALDKAKDAVEARTLELLAIRDANKELSSRIHGETFYNYQIEQVAASYQLMAVSAARVKKDKEAERKDFEKMAVEAQKIVDFLGEKTLTDFFKIKDPLMLEAVMNSQVQAVEDLLRLQGEMGIDIKDPVALAKSVATIKLTAAEQVRRLAFLEQSKRLQSFIAERKLRMNTEKDLIKTAAEGMHQIRKEMDEARRDLWRAATYQLELARREHVNRAAGGSGIDTQTVRMSPDEIVMNPAASRKFYSTLTAMNAGAQRFAGGGSPTNYNIGDINLSAPIQGDRVDVLKLGKGLRREIRRGRLRLN